MTSQAIAPSPLDMAAADQFGNGSDALRIGIIVGSTRPGRKADAVAAWVYEHGLGHTDATFEVVDIADYDLAHLDEAIPAIAGRYAHDHTHAWSTRIASFGAFVFVCPEYNHSFPGALKTAIDFLYAEWNDKAAGFVSYGVEGGGRATEQLRLVAAELKLAGVHAQVSLSLLTDVVDGDVVSSERLTDQLGTMFEELTAWGRALRALRTVA